MEINGVDMAGIEFNEDAVAAVELSNVDEMVNVIELPLGEDLLSDGPVESLDDVLADGDIEVLDEEDPLSLLVIEAADGVPGE